MTPYPHAQPMLTHLVKAMGNGPRYRASKYTWGRYCGIWLTVETRALFGWITEPVCQSLSFELRSLKNASH